MGVRITIRDVDEGVRDKLAARAARERKSMQEYLKGELERLVRRPSREALLDAVFARKRNSGRQVSAATILRARNLDRK